MDLKENTRLRNKEHRRQLENELDQDHAKLISDGLIMEMDLNNGDPNFIGLITSKDGNLSLKLVKGKCFLCDKSLSVFEFDDKTRLCIDCLEKTNKIEELFT